MLSLLWVTVACSPTLALPWLPLGAVIVIEPPVAVAPDIVRVMV